MYVEIDHAHSHVVLRGNEFEVRLTWTQAALLSTLLNEGSRELMPVLDFGKCYEPIGG